MKPQNFSLKFQNSLADSRITPGSQHGKLPTSDAPQVRNGLRALRRPTKRESRGAISKKKKDVKPVVDVKRIVVARVMGGKEVEGAVKLKSILKKSRANPDAVDPEPEQNFKPEVEEEWTGFDDEVMIK